MFKKTTAPQDPLILQLMPIVTQAGEILREEYQRYCSGADFDIEHKSDESPVTQDDFRVNDFITEQLAQQFPDVPPMSAAGAVYDRAQWPTIWMHNPLDATKELLTPGPELLINPVLVVGLLS
ncbi:inositol monophosphatase family protein, partial [Acinetobacter indicus]|uniref:inositol monophosphatase family protein n=1 Tax=Acinetobacter indicus TaxID=756892 RepID=UPI0024B6F8C7